MAAAIGAGLPVEDATGNMVVDVGGGNHRGGSNLLGGIVAKSITIAGDKMDEAIVNYMKRNYNLMIGERTAEEIKEDCRISLSFRSMKRPWKRVGVT